MDAHRIDVFHIADGDAGVGTIAHHFVFDFLPAQQATLEQHLVDGAGTKTRGYDAIELRHRVGHTAAGAAKRVGRADNKWQGNLFDEGAGFLNAVNDLALNRRFTDATEQILEQFTILGHLNRFQRCAEQADSVMIENAEFAHLYGEIEPGLATDGCQHAFRALPLDHPADHIGCQWLDVHGVGNILVRHDRGGIGIHEDGTDAFLAQALAGLRTGVVEFGRLANHDRARADNEHAFRFPGG